MIGLTALNVFVAPVTGLGVALRVSGSGWGAHWLGIADACLAAGAIVGSLAASAGSRRSGADGSGCSSSRARPAVGRLPTDLLCSP